MHLVVIDSDGSNRQVLTDGTEVIVYPTWFPDGDRLVVDVRRKGIVAIDLGSRAQELLFEPNINSPRTPALSPDGSRIAYTASPPDESPELYVADLNGDNVVRLTDHEDQDNNPSWSPDGSAIAFETHRAPPPGIFIVNADGTGMRPLTASPRSVSLESPDWSPDGRYLAFHAFGHGNMDLFILDVAVAMSAVLGESWGNLKREVGGCCE